MDATHAAVRRLDRPWIAALVGYLAIIAVIDVSAYLRLIPAVVSTIPYYDTFGHVFLIGLAGYLTHRAMARRTLRLGPLAVPLGLVLVAALAGLEELLQTLSPAREACVSDFLADLTGIAAFGLLDAWLRRSKLRRS